MVSVRNADINLWYLPILIVSDLSSVVHHHEIWYFV